MWKSEFYGAFVLNRRVDLHAIDATPARWRGDAGSSPLDGASTTASSPRNDLVKNCRVHPTHWLISTQVEAAAQAAAEPGVQVATVDGDVVAFARKLADEAWLERLPVSISAALACADFEEVLRLAVSTSRSG